MKKIEIQFFHDVICSFCFPMSYRMRKLKELMPTIKIIHRSFALVKEENDFARMFGDREKAKDEILTHWEQANENDDLHRFNIEGMRKSDFLFPTSLKGLLACKAAYHVGGEAGYWDLFDGLQWALFVENQNIELDDVILSKVIQINLNVPMWQGYFLGQQVKDEVEADLLLAEKYGLHGVPTLIINDGTMIHGAASLAQIVQAIESERYKMDDVITAEGACGIDGCEI